MDLTEIFSDKRIALSYFKVEGLEWSPKYRQIMDILERETIRKFDSKDIQKGIREFKSKDYIDEYKELRMKTIVDRPIPIKERVVQEGEIKIKDSVHYEPRDIYSIFKYESSVMIIIAQAVRDANRFISYFTDIVGGGITFKRLIFGDDVMDYFLNQIEDLYRIRMELSENDYINDILLKGLDIQHSEDYRKYRQQQESKILEMKVRIIIDNEKLITLNLRRNGRLVIYRGNVDIDYDIIDHLSSIVINRYELS